MAGSVSAGKIPSVKCCEAGGSKRDNHNGPPSLNTPFCFLLQDLTEINGCKFYGVQAPTPRRFRASVRFPGIARVKYNTLGTLKLHVIVLPQSWQSEI